MPRSTATIATLKVRAEFQRVRGGGRATAIAFVLEGKKRATSGLGSAATDAHGPRFGFTITKKVGNAVVRNKMRRRLRGALSEIVATCADVHTDYVVVARPAAADQDYRTLKSDLATAFARVNQPPRTKNVQGHTPKDPLQKK